jgi:uncharacterized protein YcaQ
VTPVALTQAQARRFLLAHQGLQTPAPYHGKAGALAFIRHVGCIQYDPLNVVGHNSDLVLQARLADYQPELLRQLLYHDRLLLDGLDKVMSIYPLEDWPCFERRRAAQRGYAGSQDERLQRIFPLVRAALQARGPLCSLDLDLGESIAWDWSQSSRLSRAALESLYLMGEVVVHHKTHTRKYYDLAQRCLPADLLATPDPHPSDQAYHDWHVLRRIGGVGLLWQRGGDIWLGMVGVQAQERQAAFARLLADGRLRAAAVAGISEPLYFRAADEPALLASLDGGSPAEPTACVLAPLDNLLWDRRLLRALFGFEYTWEVYVPPARRRYGYYVLPLLYGDRFVARFEPVQEKKRRALLVKNWWWEPEVTPGAALQAALRACLRRFLAYLGLERLELSPEARRQAGLDWLEDL